IRFRKRDCTDNIGTQKKGGSHRLPPQNSSRVSLEIEPQRELKFAHGRPTFQAGNPSVVPNPVNILAIYASLRSIIGAERVHGMVEHIECVHSELSIKSFSDTEPLGH